jgi:hypothetical protein
MNKSFLTEIAFCFLASGLMACSSHELPARQVSAAESHISNNRAVHDAGATGAATTCSKDKDLAVYMGRYKVVKVEKYGGGLTTEAQAEKELGKTMLKLSKRIVSVVGNEKISNPVYDISCQRPLAEGEITPPGQRYSNFYGFGVNRKLITILEARDPKDRDTTPYYEFEIIRNGNGIELWYMDDGWLYEMIKSS